MVARIGIAGFLTIVWGSMLLGNFVPSLNVQHSSNVVLAAMFFWLLLAGSIVVGNACFTCSECDSSLNKATGQYCPECGGSSLTDGEWWQPRRCGKCALELRYSKGVRKFKVHYCSVCGSHLDEEGL